MLLSSSSIFGLPFACYLQLLGQQTSGMVCVDWAWCTGTPDASVVHASGSRQLQADPHVAGLWLSPGKPTRRAVTAMGSNDLVVGEDHMLGPSCQRYN